MSIDARLESYCKSNDIDTTSRIGYGIHGSIFLLLHDFFDFTVGKVFEASSVYEREKAVYERLQTENVLSIEGAWIPQMISFDDELEIIEMTYVDRPFVLNFGAAWLDEPPPFGAELLNEQMTEKMANFPEEDVEKVELILDRLRELGIYQYDPTPTNICIHPLP